MIRKTPTPENQDTPIEGALYLKTYRLGKSEIAAMEQGLNAIEFLIETFKGRGDNKRADVLACHAYNLKAVLKDLEDIPATQTDMSYN